MSEERELHPSQRSRTAQTRRFAYVAVHELPEAKQTRVLGVLTAMNGAFWRLPRKQQDVALLRVTKGVWVTQEDIAVVMGVAPSFVTKYKQRFQERPNDMFPPPGRPSPLGKVFDQIEDFIADEIEDDRSVTLGVLMDFIVDELNIPATRRNVWEFLTDHGYSYVSGIPTEESRVLLDHGKVRRLYETTLPDAVNGVHPALVLNLDETGLNRYADRKRINVFVPEDAPEDGGVLVGIPRTANRFTLMACIALDGSKLKPLIVTRNKTVSSLMFEKGYSRENLILVSTKKGFVTIEVFNLWLVEVFIPAVEERRASLRRQLGTFDERAVLIMDGCKCHKIEPFRQLLDEKTSPLFFLWRIHPTSPSPSTWAFLGG